MSVVDVPPPASAEPVDSIPGLLVVRLPVHEDSRGWFKENWQREKMLALGLPDFGPVQHNVAYNARRGITRGIHAEPWDKFISVVAGRAFGAWVDLRAGESFGATFHTEIDSGTAVFVPRGVGNSYQALEDGTVYSYLVNEHWHPDATYAGIHPGDPDAAIPWPIPLTDAELSEKDQQGATLDEVEPLAPRRTLVLGSHGQLGKALMAAFPDADGVDRDALDLTDPEAVDAWPWQQYETVINAAGYTAVDAAETPDGRVAAWRVNADVPARLARIAERHRLTLVHYSTDYVFDGTVEEHTEDEPPSPLGVYAQTKAAGDLAVQSAARHYLLRTSWLVGDGRNFVATMRELATRGACPQVVDDQIGRLTFADELARATRHLLDTHAPYGTYNCTNSGPAMSWAEIARMVFRLCGRDENDVTPVSTDKYAVGKSLAPRPAHSTLRLRKLQTSGFESHDAARALDRYLDADRRSGRGEGPPRDISTR